MADLLRVDPQMLGQKATEAEEITARYRSTVNNILGEVESLKGSYTGEAAEAFYTQVRGFENDFEAAGQLFQKYAEFLRVAENNYQFTENNIIEDVRVNTSSGNSFGV